MAASIEADVTAPPRSRMFREAAEDYVKTHSEEWGEIHRNQWTQTLTDYAFPRIGAIACSDLTIADIVEVLKPGWTTKAETFRRLRGRIETVILAEAARLGNLDARNPADLKLLKHLLPKIPKSEEHHEAPTLQQLQDFVKSLGLSEVTHRMARLVAYTGCRSGEVRGARWGEVDIERKVWTIPAERMKAGRPNIVPLTQSAINALGPQGEGLVFSVGGKEPSTNAMLALLKRKKLTWTTHGIRATLRSWCSENAVPHEVAESILAHTIGDRTVRAYARSNLLEQKREVLQRWEAVLNADR